MPDGPESNLHTKGLEEELYTGTRDGEIVGVAHRVKDELPGFRTEPAASNASASARCAHARATYWLDASRGPRSQDWSTAMASVGLPVRRSARASTGAT